MKIAILGGSFNPLHNGHKMLAQKVIEKLNYDKILFVPTNIPPHKLICNKIENFHRVKMIQEFCKTEQENHFVCETCEIERGGVSYTCDTLKFLYEKYKNQVSGKFGLIMGEEIASEFNKWKNYIEVSKIVDFIITSRQKTEEENSSTNSQNSFKKLTKNIPINNYQGDFNTEFKKDIFPYSFTFLQENIPSISSSKIREKIQKNEDIKNLVPFSVYNYIKKQGLYK